MKPLLSPIARIDGVDGTTSPVSAFHALESYFKVRQRTSDSFAHISSPDNMAKMMRSPLTRQVIMGGEMVNPGQVSLNPLVLM